MSLADGAAWEKEFGFWNEKIEETKRLYFVEISFMNSPQHTVRIRESDSGLALLKTLKDYDPYLRQNIIGTKITYIGD